MKYSLLKCASIGAALALGMNTQASSQTTTTLNPTADAYIESGQPGVNFGAASILLVRQTDTATNLSRASYLNFSLSGLPAGAVTSAKLRLYGRHETAGVGVPVGVRGATDTSAWGEAALTWANAYQLAPVNYASAAIATTTVSGTAAQYYEWDVTAFIASRQASGFATLSAYTSVLNQYRVSFNSKEGVNKPQLVVVTAGWEPTCPGNYDPVPGVNRDFPTPTGNRAFSLNLPSSTATPRPVWVPLTGAVESTNENLDSRGGNRALTADGYIVIGPVRKCANQDPNGAGTGVNGGICNSAGSGGWHFNPWNDARAASTSGNLWMNSEGPDSLFLEAIVKCVAKKYPVDQSRVFLGGISFGGTMATRALLFNSDFWAGGMPISNEWYVTKSDGAALTFEQGRAAVRAAYTVVHEGRVGPLPLRTNTSTIPMYPMIVLTVWGGANDKWSCGSILCSDFRPPTQVGSNYFSSLNNVVHIACSASHGHQWPTTNRAAFNSWALRTLSSHPKGTPKAAFGNKLVTNPPPSGYSCRVGPYTDHYPSDF